MAERKDIPHLLALLEDDSPDVRENVVSALRGFGPELEKEAVPFLESLSGEQRHFLDKLSGEIRLQSFHESWLNWLEMEDEREALEFAFSRLAYLDYGCLEPPLEELLDDLATDFLQTQQPAKTEDLMIFLFRELGFKAPVKNFYNPLNSNLIYVIRERQGIQISLSSIAILTGRRLGIELFGLNLPGHFMTLSFEEGESRVYDCFNKGRPLPKQTSWYLQQSLKLTQSSVMKLKAKTHEIILRVLRNLVNAHFRKADHQQVSFYSGLFDKLAAEVKQRQL